MEGEPFAGTPGVARKLRRPVAVHGNAVRNHANIAQPVIPNHAVRDRLRDRHGDHPPAKHVAMEPLGNPSTVPVRGSMHGVNSRDSAIAQQRRGRVAQRAEVSVNDVWSKYLDQMHDPFEEARIEPRPLSQAPEWDVMSGQNALQSRPNPVKQTDHRRSEQTRGQIRR